MGFFDFFRKTRTLDEAINRPVKVTVHGVKFQLRKLNALDYVSGAKALHMHFDTYKTKTERQQLDMASENTGKIREHYVDVFMASVVEPKLSRKKDGEGIFVENLFSDWDLANELYFRILEVSYGKKNLRSSISQRTAS